ncbi:MAG: DUF4906 domain-containing protein [Bacteroidales bacterium]|nr:DUF4906 domain-containing protein [Bacteroidales bacterium]
MVRRFIYILLSLAVAVSAVSCLEEMEVAQPKPEGSDETILVPRVKSFTNQYITKGYATNETKITNLALLVFNNDGALVHIAETSDENNVSSITLNKSLLNSPAQRAKLTSATVVMIANVGLDNVKNSGETSIKAANAATTLELGDLNDYSFHLDDEQTVVTSLGDGFTGFPMIGSSSGVDLSLSVDHTNNPVQVNLQILYAKVNFSISVAPCIENQNYTGVTPSFTLTGYSVHNVSKRTPYTQPTGATVSTDYAYTGEDEEDKRVGSARGTTALNGDAVSFTFYVAESRYAHNSTLQGVYPDDSWLTTTHYDDLKQQYKPKIANLETGTPSAGLATYVTVSGTYKDYRGTNWTVDYKVYLGKDNSQNFEVDRNSEYTNYLTIKGIRNNDSYDDNDQSVWVDHRVNVSTGDLAGNVRITRETLIDSHIEVRPLRVKFDPEEYLGVLMYLPVNADGNLVNWIGIERFTGSNNQDGTVYCYNGTQSTGKRKYFTTGLIGELQTKEGGFGVQTEENTGRKYIPLDNGDCAWIYFDENPASTTRTASIVLSFIPLSGNSVSEIYEVRQSGIQTIGGYKVESYEEYLHSYDSEDKFNLSTSPVDYSQQGLAWGLANQTISQDIIVSAIPFSEFLGIDFRDAIYQRYDYFHNYDRPEGDTYYSYIEDDSGDWTQAGTGTGLVFTDRASANKDITIKDMGTIPENAYQYCLSKNKFREDPDGNHTLDIHWYLPDVYELQAVLAATQSAEDFGTDSYYWSSQPSYTGRVTQNIGFIDEVISNARAVSATETRDVTRATQNRIRCFYSPQGITADMSDRTPDGIGGNFSFYMKAYRDKGKSAEAYFKYLLPPAVKTEKKDNEYQYDDTSFPYPTKANSYQNTAAEFKYVVTKDKNNNPAEGFEVDPAVQSNWNEYIIDLGQGYNTGHYTTLSTYPGLTEFTTEKLGATIFPDWLVSLIGILGIDLEDLLIDAYIPTTTRKSDVETVTTSMNIDLSKDLESATDLKTLDHLLGNDKLKVDFERGVGNNIPTFVYNEYESGSKVENTRYWEKPVYVPTTYQMIPEQVTLTASGTGTQSAEAIGLLGGRNAARQEAFGGSITQPGGAYQKAKDNARVQLESLIAAEYSGWTVGTINYPTLTWQSPEPYVKYTNETTGSTLRPYQSTCTVTLTATVTLTKAGDLTLYTQSSGGHWSAPTSVTTPYSSTVNTDELRFYFGNSLTISLAPEYQGRYEITKVKVHCSGNTQFAAPGVGNYVHGRFVKSNITLPISSEPVSFWGATDVLELPGMEYNEDVSSGVGWHQWTGSGTDSVTLSLSDYSVSTDLSGLSLVTTYKYAKASTNLSRYVVIDRIEIKCTPIATEDE